ncbi:MAG TPA: methyl-accepting chemotaxis protein [Spirochaetota bacterium]|nr:methyl-accepting chemotaxis protein [Spirochaetota bacterium]
MFEFFRYLRIKTKLIFGFSILLVIFVLLSFVIIWSINEFRKERLLITTSKEILLELANARIMEKDFFITKNLELAKSNNKMMASIKENIEKLNKQSRDKNLNVKLDNLSKFLSYYSNLFNQVVDLYVQKGLDEKSGVIGEFRGAIHLVEDKTKNSNPYIQISLLKARRHEKDYMLRGRDEYVTKFGEEVMKLKSMVEYDDELAGYVDNYFALFYRMLSLDKDIIQYKEEFETYLKKIDPVIEEYNTTVNKTILDNEQKILFATITGLVLFVLIIIIVTYILSKSITTPINNISKKLKEISQGNGDLTQKLPLRYLNCSAKKNCNNKECIEYGKSNNSCYKTVGSFAQEISCPSIKGGKLKSCEECYVFKKITNDELSVMSFWFNDFVEYLQNTIIKIKNVMTNSKKISENLTIVSNKISESSDEIMKNNKNNSEKIFKLNDEIKKSTQSVSEIVSAIDQITTSIEGESAAINQSSSSIEEMSASLENIFNIARDKRTLSERLSNSAQSGIETMSNSITSIENVTGYANNILDIIGVINAIAEHTDLLAMNAAIEAAHAGESGKGFSVVADEVRKLAEQSLENSKIIDVSLKKIVNEIKVANSLNKESGTFFDQIVGGIKDIVNSMEEMINGIEELKVGSNEIVKAITSILEVSEDIKKGEIDIDNNAKMIKDNIIKISEFSGDVLNSMEEESIKISQISDALTNFNRMGIENEKNINIIFEQINSFKT